MRAHLKRVWLALLIAALMAAACNNDSNETDTQGASTARPTPGPAVIGQVALTVWHSFSGALAEALQSATQTFNAPDSPVTVVLEYHAPESLLADYETAVANGAGPDILAAQPEWVAHLADQRLILPMGNLLATALENQLIEPVYYSLVYRDQVWASPLVADTLLLYSNSGLISSEPESFDDILQAAQEHPALFPAQTEKLLGLYQDPAISLMSESGQSRLTQPAVRDFLELYQRLANSPGVAFTDDASAFLEGRAGMIVREASAYPALAAALGDQLRVSVLPQGGAVVWRPAVQITPLVINVNTPENTYQAATLYLLYLLKPETQTALAEATGFQPLASADSSQSQAGRAFAGQLRFARARPLDGLYFDAMLPALTAALAQARVLDASLDPLVAEVLAAVQPAP
jgi:ABC-type glycerol-3-phosphate transport system substrate-binding protein